QRIAALGLRAFPVGDGESLGEAPGKHCYVASVAVLQLNFELADIEMVIRRVDPSAVEGELDVAAAEAQRHYNAFDAGFEDGPQFLLDVMGQQWCQRRVPGKAQLGSVAIDLVLPLVPLDNVRPGGLDGLQIC